MSIFLRKKHFHRENRGYKEELFMDQRHKEYTGYYEARVKKAEQNSLYPNLAAAEKELYKAISTAKDLEEFAKCVEKNKLELKCAIAKVKDQETALSNYYLSIQEEVRAKSSLEVLSKLEDVQSIDELTTMVSEVHNKWLTQISADETIIPEFWNVFSMLENIEETKKAKVPSMWKTERKEFVRKTIADGTQSWSNFLNDQKKFKPDYKYNHKLIWADRHRRKIPLSDKVVKRRIENHKQYVGVK